MKECNVLLGGGENSVWAGVIATHEEMRDEVGPIGLR